MTCNTKLDDPAAFERAYDAHHRSVYATAMRVLGDHARAQDVVQDVFLRLWRNPRGFDARRGELGAYLRLMARSRAIDLWRERDAATRAQDRLQVAAQRAEPVAGERPEVVAQRGHDGRLVRAALGSLPEAQREAVVLAYWGGLTADEIARRVRIPVGTAKSRIRLGLARLAGAVGETLGEPAARAA